MANARPSREDDEKLLQMLTLRCAGWSSWQISVRLGISESYARAGTNRIRSADRKESGEQARIVEAGYW